LTPLRSEHLIKKKELSHPLMTFDKTFNNLTLKLSHLLTPNKIKSYSLTNKNAKYYPKIYFLKKKPTRSYKKKSLFLKIISWIWLKLLLPKELKKSQLKISHLKKPSPNSKEKKKSEKINSPKKLKNHSEIR
jgi:hypothetical protein